MGYEAYRVSGHRPDVRGNRHERTEGIDDCVDDAMGDVGFRKKNDEEDDEGRVRDETPRDEGADDTTNVLDKPQVARNAWTAVQTKTTPEWSTVDRHDSIFVVGIVNSSHATDRSHFPPRRRH